MWSKNKYLRLMNSQSLSKPDLDLESISETLVKTPKTRHAIELAMIYQCAGWNPCSGLLLNEIYRSLNVNSIYSDFLRPVTLDIGKINAVSAGGFEGGSFDYFQKKCPGFNRNRTTNYFYYFSNGKKGYYNSHYGLPADRYNYTKLDPKIVEYSTMHDQNEGLFLKRYFGLKEINFYEFLEIQRIDSNLRDRIRMYFIPFWEILQGRPLYGKDNKYEIITYKFNRQYYLKSEKK
jgi:hypothetical protein